MRVAASFALFALSAAAWAAPNGGWRVHDTTRPKPPVVTPPPQKLPAPVPPDAVRLFDGSGLSDWVSVAGGPARWKVENGELVVTPGMGPIQTRRGFGDVQVHVEWASPVPASGRSQGRGNSGVFLMGKYEVQVLDSYRNETYADGQAGAIYGQYPPLVNACRPPGEWQSYDITFRRPRFDSAGNLLQKARVTVLHNGVLVQDNVEILGPTIWLHYQDYKAHPDRLPISLQEHGNPVRFRNIWVREIGETPEFKLAEPAPSAVRIRDLKRYTGSYIAFRGANELPIDITARRGRLYFNVPSREQSIELVPRSEREFDFSTTDARVIFDLDGQGKAKGLRFIVAGETTVEAPRVSRQ